MSTRNEHTSNAVVAKASKILKDPKSTKVMRLIAASVLNQAPDRTKRRKP